VPVVSLPPGDGLAFNVRLPLPSAGPGERFDPGVKEGEVEAQLAVVGGNWLDEGRIERCPEHVLPMRPHAVEQLIRTGPPVRAPRWHPPILHLFRTHREPVRQQQLTLKRHGRRVNGQLQWQFHDRVPRHHFDLRAIVPRDRRGGHLYIQPETLRPVGRQFPDGAGKQRIGQLGRRFGHAFLSGRKVRPAGDRHAAHSAHTNLQTRSQRRGLQRYTASGRTAHGHLDRFILAARGMQRPSHGGRGGHVADQHLLERISPPGLHRHLVPTSVDRAGPDEHQCAAHKSHQIIPPQYPECDWPTL